MSTQPAALWNRIIDCGTVVLSQSGDNGGPGAAGGPVTVHMYQGKFYGCNDVDSTGPFDTLDEAARSLGAEPRGSN